MSCCICKEDNTSTSKIIDVELFNDDPGIDEEGHNLKNTPVNTKVCTDCISELIRVGVSGTNSKLTEFMAIGIGFHATPKNLIAYSEWMSGFGPGRDEQEIITNILGAEVEFHIDTSISINSDFIPVEKTGNGYTPWAFLLDCGHALTMNDEEKIARRRIGNKHKCPRCFSKSEITKVVKSSPVNV